MNVLHWLKTGVTHPGFGFMLRLYVGGVFVYASMYKINYPGEFAETIASYQLAPFWAVNPMAVIMPWAELIAGLLLVLGFRTKAAAGLIAAMLAMFSLAIALTLLRGIPIGCGCFTSAEEPLGWGTLLRDLIWLAMTLQVYRFPSALRLETRLLAAFKEIAQ